jgi:hypothetical protein
MSMAEESEPAETAARIERTGTQQGRMSVTAIAFLRRIESVVLYAIAIVLILLAILLLASTVYALYVAVATGHVQNQAVQILDSVLLVMMTMEIVYTVALSIESHRLIAEPFLVVGAIAAIRRMLVITAQSAATEALNAQAINATLIELGLLAFTVLVIAVSIYILRRSQTYLPPGEE